MHTHSLMLNTGVVSTIAGNGTASCTDGPGNVATFNKPYDVKIDTRDGSLLAADYGNNRVRKISNTGMITNNTLLLIVLILSLNSGIVSTISWPEGGKLESEVKQPYCLTVDTQTSVCYIGNPYQLKRLHLA